MKSISIKYFTLFAVLFLLSGVIATFFSFYATTKSNITELVKNDIQNSALDIKYFLNKNLQNDNINKLISYLDSIASSNILINDIHIIDTSNKKIYSSDRGYDKNDVSCLNISKISKENVLEEACYNFSITLYDRLDPYYYKSEIFINNNYIHKLIYDNTIEILTYFSILLIAFFLLLWFILKKSIIIPLEQLRQFAYYSDKVPKNFFVNEIESIRYSLDMTFKRLRKEQEELYSLSTKDQLSGLYNRMSLIEKIEWLITNKDRKEEKFAIIFLDLDNFKNINDSMGHNFGDKILQEVSTVLLSSVRDNDIVSRIGGDEFVLVLPDVENETKIIDVLRRIQSQLVTPIVLNDFKYTITASMGIAIYPNDGEDVHSLLKNADIAMYKSKDLGKNTYHFFTDTLNQIIQEKVAMQNLLLEALEEDHFHLYYQPKTDVRTGKIVACEALIRLIDPKKGLIPPDRFIPLAEESNLIIQIGEWVIKESTKQIKEWQTTELKDIKVSINVSAKQFKDTHLLETLSSATKNIDVSLLDIELTESVFIDSFESTFNIIHKIKELGFSLSLDDFGTGYSSLSYLKKIPFDTLKIDKTFIDDLDTDESDNNFVNMIVDISKKLHLEIVAEGVETKKQLEYLKEIKCDIYQGYYCSKPLPVKDFEELVKVNNKV